MLSRREIIKLILTEATQRSRDVQTLLKLDAIDQIRASLRTTENKLNSEHSSARAQADAAEDALKRHFDLTALKAEDLLSITNSRRKILGLSAISALAKDTDLSEGVSFTGGNVELAQGKQSALADVKALTDAITGGVVNTTGSPLRIMLQDLATLEADPALVTLIRRHSFFEGGLALLDGPSCPLCDTSWDVVVLREHLTLKLEKSKAAQALRDRLVEAAQAISNEITRLKPLIQSLLKVPETGSDLANQAANWLAELLSFSAQLQVLDGIIAAKDRLAGGWLNVPDSLVTDLGVTRDRIASCADKGTLGDAQSFLVVAQERLNNVRSARRKAEEKRASAGRGRVAYKIRSIVSNSANFSKRIFQIRNSLSRLTMKCGHARLDRRAL